ncbi:MAG: hypothetical protein JXB29_00930 [Sedimentisphaerales bacterium]|nr:hypothetical protein [Sedimentisphaerales bacterium]
MTISAKRAEYTAAALMILSVVFFIIAMLLGRWSGFFAVSAVSFFVLSEAFICLVLWIQFHQSSLAEQEKLDLRQLSEKERSSTIFQAKGQGGRLFAVAAGRLEILEKWFLPVFSAAIAVYQIAIGFFLLKSIGGFFDVETKRPLICAVAMMVIAFVSFLFSRYATGMSGQMQWRPLRAAGSFMLGVSILCFALAIALALWQFKIFVVINVINWVIPVLLILIGLETGLNAILDIYRPRLKGQYHRAAFDSRLLGVINEPGGLFRSAASAIDYQFGFKVSQTWFYKLLEKAIVPLVLFGAAALYLISCVVVLGPNEQAIIEHFGNPLHSTGNARMVGPGLTFKWPWPIDIAYKYPTKKIVEAKIGFVPKTDPKTGQIIHEPLLWGNAHYREEYNVLVASPQTRVDEQGAVPVSIVKANIPVQYRVRDLYSFIYNHSEPERLFESICYQELAKFMASSTIEVDEDVSAGRHLKDSLLGAGRAEAKKVLSQRIQATADEAGLGIELVFLGLQGIHPPPDEQVAASYQEVIGSVQKKQALILEAQAQLNKVLSSLVGSVEQADELYQLAASYDKARRDKSTDKSEQLEEELDAAFGQASGEVFQTLREAKSYAFEKATLARATGERFSSQLKAFTAAPQIYVREQRLGMLEDSLKNIRKFIVAADENNIEVFIVDLQKKLEPSLYEIPELEESKKR